MNSGKKFNLGLISKYRGELFGLGIISIMVFHYFLRIVNHGSGTLYPLARVYDSVIRSVGVECFLFLSGVGLCFSMIKDSNALHFYKKRVSRVVIPYLVWGTIFWMALDLVAKGKSISYYLLDLSLISFWTKGNCLLWYIAFILLLYLAFPLIYKMFNGRHPTVNLFICVALCVACALALNKLSPKVYENIELALNRIPIFLFGAYMGKRIYNCDDFRWGDFAVAALGIVVHICGILQRRNIIPIKLNFSRYEFALFSISLIYICVWILSKVKLNRLKAFLRAAGTISLELYMTHVCIDNLMRYCGIPTYKIYYYAILIIISIILSIMLHFSLKNIIIKQKTINKKQKN